MTTFNYFKAVTADRTYFRGSKSKDYVSYINKGDFRDGFSSGPVAPGRVPAIKIEKPEYDALVALKNARNNSNAPSNSWVYNTDLEGRNAVAEVLAAPAAGEPGPALLAEIMNAPIKKARAAKAAKAAAKPAKLAAKPAKSAKLAAEKAPTVHERIWALIGREDGVTEKEVCEALGWKRAGATIGRAIKKAPFAVRKQREGARVRFFADAASA